MAMAAHRLRFTTILYLLSSISFFGPAGVQQLRKPYFAENRYTVVDLYVCPGRRTVVGQSG
jgi:hypothetical protein